MNISMQADIGKLHALIGSLPNQLYQDYETAYLIAKEIQNTAFVLANKIFLQTRPSGTVKQEIEDVLE